jgi:hypothetical protein
MATMTDHAFTDDALRHFLTDGYSLIESDHPPGFHQDMVERLDHVMESEGNPGNNILPRVPQIQRVFDAPRVSAALTRILGPGYIMHPHRHCHHRPPGSKPQGWHKDDYVYDQNARHHRGRWVMAFYYPQAVSADMGATGIVPGYQHHDTTAALKADPTLEMSITGAAGMVAIVNFDIWHRGGQNTSPHHRHMLKFQFLRMQEPETSDAPRNQSSPEWADTESIARHQWDWLHGGSDDPSHGNGVDSVAAIEQLLSDDEAMRLQATYALAEMGEESVAPLVDSLREEATQRGESKTSKSPANPAGGNPADLATAHALAALGPSSIGALVDLSAHSHWAVRATAVDVLGTIGAPAASAEPTIRQALRDENVWVRRNAAEALGILSDANSTGALGAALTDEDWRVRLNAAGALARIGPEANSSTHDVSLLLDDENRYVRANAIQALERFASPEATDALLHHLMSARWCSLTSKDSKY